MSSTPDDSRASDKESAGIAPPEANLRPLDYREQFSGKHAPSHFIDPCQEASKASMDCLDRNNYDRDACLEYFRAYRDCKKAWIQHRKDDRRAGRPTK